MNQSKPSTRVEEAIFVMVGAFINDPGEVERALAYPEWGHLAPAERRAVIDAFPAPVNTYGGAL